jgi:hypothetical protein
MMIQYGGRAQLHKFRKKLMFLVVVAAACFTALLIVQIYVPVFSISQLLKESVGG